MRGRSVVIIVLSVVALAGCGGGDEGADDTADDTVPVGATDSTAPAPTDPVTTDPVATDPADTVPASASSVPTDTDPPATPAPSTSPVGSSGPCPVGTWNADNAQMQGYYDTVGQVVGVEFTLEGDLLLELTPTGEFTYTPRDFVLGQNAAGTVMSVSLDGTVGGSYTSDGGVLRTTNVAADLTATATVNGATVDASAIVDELLRDFPLNEATYECVGDDLVVDFRVLGTTAGVTMTPA